MSSCLNISNFARDELHRGYTKPILQEAGIKKGSVQSLCYGLRVNDKDVRKAAAMELGRMGGSAISATSCLERALGDENVLVRVFVINALGNIGRSILFSSKINPQQISNVLKAFEKSSRDQAHNVMQAYSRWLAQTILPLSLKNIASQNANTRYQTLIKFQGIEASTLSRLLQGSASRVVVSSLKGLLRDNNWRVRVEATLLLSKMGKKFIPNLITMLRDRNWQVRRSAVKALSQFQSTNPSISKIIQRLFMDKNRMVRQAVVTAIPSSKHTLDNRHKVIGKRGLIDALKDKNWRIRRNATTILGKLGEKFYPKIVEMFSDSHWEVRKAAISSLNKYIWKNPQLAKHLLRALQDNNSDVRKESLKKLKDCDLDVLNPLVSSRFFHLLILSLRDLSKRNRQLASKIIQKIGVATLPQLVSMLRSSSWKLREAAVLSIGLIGSHSSSSIPPLKKMLSEKNKKVQDALGKTLYRLRPMTLNLYKEWKTKQMITWSSNTRKNCYISNNSYHSWLHIASEFRKILVVSKAIAKKLRFLSSSINLQLEDHATLERTTKYAKAKLVNLSNQMRIAASSLNSHRIHSLEKLEKKKVTQCANKLNQYTNYLMTEIDGYLSRLQTLEDKHIGEYKRRIISRTQILRLSFKRKRRAYTKKYPIYSSIRTCNRVRGHWHSGLFTIPKDSFLHSCNAGAKFIYCVDYTYYRYSKVCRIAEYECCKSRTTSKIVGYRSVHRPSVWSTLLHLKDTVKNNSPKAYKIQYKYKSRCGTVLVALQRKRTCKALPRRSCQENSFYKRKVVLTIPGKHVCLRKGVTINIFRIKKLNR